MTNGMGKTKWNYLLNVGLKIPIARAKTNKNIIQFLNLILNLIMGALVEVVFISLSLGLEKISTTLEADGSPLFKFICDRLSDFMLIIGTALVIMFVFVTSLQFLLELYKSFMGALRGNEGGTKEEGQQEER